MLGIQQSIQRDGGAHQRLVALQRATVAIQPSGWFRGDAWLRNVLIHQRELSLLGNQGQQKVMQALSTGLR